MTNTVLAPTVVVLDVFSRDVVGWLSSGKGAMSMSGYLDDPDVDFLANPLLATVGLEYTGAVLNGPVTTFEPHPVTQGITEMTFLGGYVIGEIDGSTAVRTPIASMEPGTVGEVAQLGQGRAFVWGDEWIEYDSEWSTLPEVQQFWVNIFAWLAPKRCQLQPKVK